ncbi:MAG TPA: LacI family DNA-binding transcriptional regulator [Bacillales bacterium]|nr:LacI family DNA-binding transcriptional regulator [Bacillales bacterium]
MKKTIKDVAKLADVSISTVSRVLNNSAQVDEQKRRKVLNAVEALNYQPNALARGLISGKTKTLAVMISDVKSLYFPELLHGMEEAARDEGYNLMICGMNRDHKTILSYLQILNEKRVDGIIFTSEPVYPDYQEIFEQMGIPVLLVSTQSMEYEIPSIKINDEQAAFDAADYLISLGHRKIGMISFPLSDPIAGLPRYQGFMRALRKNGLEAPDDGCEIAPHWFQNGSQATKKLFAKHPDLTAVFAASDELALGAISALTEMGKTVPGDVSVVGFDNLRISQMCIPKLTTIAQPLDEIGHKAIEKITALIDGNDLGPLREIVSHELIERDSTASPNP